MAILVPNRTRALPQPSAGVWPGLHERATAPVHAAIARRLVHAAVRRLPLSLQFPDGTTWGAGGPAVQLVAPKSFFHRLGTDGLIGFGEAWMTGDFTTGEWSATDPTLDPVRINAATDELTEVLTVLARRASVLVPAPVQRLRKAWQHRPPSSEDNTVTAAADNIHRHYDLSNDLFELFLDPSLSYSAAWFDPVSTDLDLEAAQLCKIDAILDLARVGPGMEVLEIGSGWGALAIRAAQQRGARVTTLTLSERQKELADRRIAAAGLSDRVRVVLTDYRTHAEQHQGEYDAAVSVEMIEAVGERYWPVYFGAVDRMLEPEARFALQAITIAHSRLLQTRDCYTWVHKYVFPGGTLPSLRAIDDQLADVGARRVLEARRIGPSYVPTLRRWRHRFNERLDEVVNLGFDNTFIRMWNFYLSYSEAGFASGYLDDWQLGIGYA